MKRIALNSKLVIGIYIALTVIKFFTASDAQQREDDPAIIFKIVPTLTDTFGGSDWRIERDRLNHSWYAKGQYWVLLRNDQYYIIYYTYLTLIFLWWFMTVVLIIMGFRKAYNKLCKQYESKLHEKK